MAVVPAAKAMYLCDYHVGSSNGKVDLHGLFNAIRPKLGFPHTRTRFCVFAQLVNGLGDVPFFIDVRRADDELVHTTATNILHFPDRTTVVQMALGMEGCCFERPGLYLIELLCNNQWVCDASVLVH